jgi:hypothetical protein
MKQITDVYNLIIKLNEMQIEVVMKHSLFVRNHSPEYTELPTKEIYPVKPIQVFFYCNDTYDTMCDRAERFIAYYQEFLKNYSNNDFIALLDDAPLNKYKRFMDSKKPH